MGVSGDLLNILALLFAGGVTGSAMLCPLDSGVTPLRFLRFFLAAGASFGSSLGCVARSVSHVCCLSSDDCVGVSAGGGIGGSSSGTGVSSCFKARGADAALQCDASWEITAQSQPLQKPMCPWLLYKHNRTQHILQTDKIIQDLIIRKSQATKVMKSKRVSEAFVSQEPSAQLDAQDAQAQVPVHLPWQHVDTCCVSMYFNIFHPQFILLPRGCHSYRTMCNIDGTTKIIIACLFDSKPGSPKLPKGQILQHTMDRLAMSPSRTPVYQ